MQTRHISTISRTLLTGLIALALFSPFSTPLAEAANDTVLNAQDYQAEAPQPLTSEEEITLDALNNKVDNGEELTPDENGQLVTLSQKKELYEQYQNKQQQGEFIVAGGPIRESCNLWNVFCHMRNMFRWTIFAVGEIIGMIIGFFITILASFISIIIEINQDIIGSPLVEAGFRISLSVANLGFVLAIIVIAFTTILRLEGYETKKLLRNLVIAAVLVNFSMLIVGVALDFTGAIGMFFIKAASLDGNIGGFADKFAAVFNIQNLFVVNNSPGIASAAEAAGELGNTYIGFLNMVLTFVAMIITGILSLIAIGAIVFMLLVRYVILTILLILMPIAWLSFAIPQLSAGIWDKWWKSFLKWIFFFPAVAFFLYLAMLSFDAVGTRLDDKIKNSPPAIAAGNVTLDRGAVGHLMQIIVMVGLMGGGIYAADKMSIAGGKAAFGGAKNFATKFTGYKSSFKERMGEWGDKAGGKILKPMLKPVARTPVIRRALQPLSTHLEKGIGEVEKERIEKGGGIKVGKTGTMRFPYGARGAEDIAKEVQRDPSKLTNVQKAARGKWRSFVPYANREKAKNIQALAFLDGKLQVGTTMEPIFKDSGLKDAKGKPVMQEVGQRSVPKMYTLEGGDEKLVNIFQKKMENYMTSDKRSSKDEDLEHMAHKLTEMGYGTSHGEGHGKDHDEKHPAPHAAGGGGAKGGRDH